MKLEQSFDVGASPDTVWALLIDLERVGPCLPGAEITGRDDDGTYHGTFTVKLGPTTAAYNGKVHFEELDEQSHRAVMRASGQDKRGNVADGSLDRLHFEACAPRGATEQGDGEAVIVDR